MSSDKDPELELIRLRKLMNLMAQQPKKSLEEKPIDVVGEIKAMVKGERAGEIINKAIEIYGEAALSVFRQLIKLRRDGAISELTDGELYNILENVGLHVPIETKVRIVRHGKEEKIGGGQS
ncbi:DNA-binding protein [Caldivirga sp. UBA161]|uniref:DNA-binding protein n=1 Tax=Caldivirga sp. UBA161 TaxID=1915569 RepID=UPI0025BEA45C|nr:DNA-binding protein [Caldivirga sp. UBA161]